MPTIPMYDELGKGEVKGEGSETVELVHDSDLSVQDEQVKESFRQKWEDKIKHDFRQAVEEVMATGDEKTNFLSTLVRHAAIEKVIDANTELVAIYEDTSNSIEKRTLKEVLDTAWEEIYPEKVRPAEEAFEEKFQKDQEDLEKASEARAKEDLDAA